jgi:DMSO/TMAO reductase YedYZ molybdopterin-dependent catalytic subunit
VDRREFLTLWGGALLLPAQALRADHHVVSVSPLEVEFDLSSLEGRYTRVEDFYVRNHHESPQDSGEPLLRVEGEVAKPQRLTLADLGHLKKLQCGAVLECAGNPVATRGLVSNGLWGGWPLWALLELAQPSDGAGFVQLFGRDRYGRSVPMDRAHDAMVVTELNGRPLRPNHGAPWRAFFPGWYGMDSVKWLDRLVVSKTPLAGNQNEYVELRSTSLGGLERRPLPRIQVKSLIVSPASRSVVHRGNIEVKGLAWSGEGEISNVEISTDGGTHWRRAVSASGSGYEWISWQASVELSRRGVVELVCRATDQRGHSQPEQSDPERLDGYTQHWYHRVKVLVV